jgi:uncharacterized protein YbjT (DUF2867 family)
MSIYHVYNVSNSHVFIAQGGSMATSHHDQAPVLVLGANGKTGSRVAQRLRAQGRNVRACSRSTQPRFDWNHRETWSAALRDAKSVYVTFQPDLAVPGALETVSAFFDAALAHGTRRIVLLSGRGEEEAQAAEEALKQSGANWTILRCSWFMQNFSEGFFLEPIRAGTLALPASRITEPFVDAEDIADVAVAVLTQSGHEGQLYELTGAQSLSFADATACIAKNIERPLTFESITVEDFHAGLTQAGVPESEKKLILYLFTTVLDGRNATPSNGVQRALDRQPRSFLDFVRRTAASGAWTS